MDPDLMQLYAARAEQEACKKRLLAKGDRSSIEYLFLQIEEGMGLEGADLKLKEILQEETDG